MNSWFMTLMLILSIAMLKAEDKNVVTSAVTYTFSGGRFGDQLLSYMHAKWVSYKYNIPLLYKPFAYSDQLVLHSIEQPYSHSMKKKFKQVNMLKKGQDLIIDPYDEILYVIPYFPECWLDRVKAQKAYPYFEVDWQDEGFKRVLQESVCPRSELTQINLPADKITVAVHVRKNSGGFDLPLLHGLPKELFNPKQLYVDQRFPLKHPPDEYYIEQIRYISKVFNYQPLYVYVFTDDPQPAKIAQKYIEALNSDTIEIDYRRADNNHHSNVLEDFFALTQFDCLIRSESNFSITASKLANYKLLIYPKTHHWKDLTTLVIDEVVVDGELAP